MKTNKFITIFTTLSVFFILWGSISRVQAQKKSNGSHLVLFFGTPSYWKKSSEQLIKLYPQLIQGGKYLTIPFIEVPKTPKKEYIYIYAKFYFKGKKAFSNQKYAKARKLLSQAGDQFFKLAQKSGFSYKLRRRISLSYLYLGAAQLFDALIDEANISFRKAYMVYPGYPLPSSAYKGEATKKAFERAMVYPGKSGGVYSLQVKSPVTGQVFINGHFVGVTPITVEGIQKGVHALTWARLGYKPSFQMIKTGDSKKTVVEIKPKKADNYATLSTKIEETGKFLRQNKNDVPPFLPELTKKVRNNDILVFRSSVNDAEISWYDKDIGSWKKRVRKQNIIPGNLSDKTVANLFKPTPVYDMDKIVEAQLRCYSSRDCSRGDCIAGKCVVSSPIYKKWWFWTAIGVGAAALGAGTYFLFQVQNRPVFEFSSP
ncbi:MAG: PEGA domain-containing protein [Deltaproteobacteria bacterium]|nr:PEGA domain-containing protein [Deltaproteobacteria bacterium]